MTNPLTDTDNVIQQLIDSMETEQETMGERMKDHIVDLFDYKKYSDKKQGQRHTGTAVDISKCEDLCVVDVDINKSLQAEQTKTIRNSILDKLPRNVGLVQTAHGGLHIYCELCNYPLKCSSQTKVFTSPENDIDIFAGIGDGKQRLVVQADSSYREMKDGKRIITKYIPLNNYRELTDLSSLECVLDVFGIDLKTENTSATIAAEPHNLLTQDGIVEMSPTVALALFDGLKDVEIHNDTAETSHVLKSLQGIGKNIWTNVLVELLAGYSYPNVTEIAELTGQFHSIVEGKMLIVLNELKNVGDDRTANFDALKSIITDSTIRINEKNQPRRTAENVANFIFVTNHTYPVKIEIGDRRYVVCDCNSKYKNNLTFFKDFTNSFDNEFYEQLLCYFLSKDLTNFNTRAIPTTEAKEDIIAASLSVIDVFCQEHYNKLKEGWRCSDALCFRPVEYKNDRSFQLAIKDRCERKQMGGRGNQVWCYKLKPEYEQLFKRREDEDDMDRSVEIN
ncbi:putative Poxvirus D5 protein [Monocercomonoides exilis]|uniref:putative Poxvirus D5 protein n=1 Tax=Monocercomonoides exilis TaxID=2049356 RepID=UPI00355A4BA8|nr:putative Poxvirus D5 protein [Monocercomonoides exilis]|eukprot:MONOS_14062.1-p1 / transcript=MONOS_14062.1 / gene=MONOS_14062 / organism=Monocercomonoides_exilis_PA203 / gene_product=Poxvirus D5 protein / transcript_product=Poxvirus D5 protein / location=Mono_scaffold00929:17111-18819(-) / protein_length=506 / sequence_SO=supercontig / SO=protein_coding / is_pseudo=false